MPEDKETKRILKQLDRCKTCTVENCDDEVCQEKYREKVSVHAAGKS